MDGCGEQHSVSRESERVCRHAQRGEQRLNNVGSSSAYTVIQFYMIVLDSKFSHQNRKTSYDSLCRLLGVQKTFHYHLLGLKQEPSSSRIMGCSTVKVLSLL